MSVLQNLAIVVDDPTSLLSPAAPTRRSRFPKSDTSATSQRSPNTVLRQASKPGSASRVRGGFGRQKPIFFANFRTTPSGRRSDASVRPSTTSAIHANNSAIADDPVARCARPAPAPSPPPRPGEADVSIGADRPSSSVHRRICQQQFRQKEMSTSASSRSAASRPVQVGLPQSALESAPASRARVTAAQAVDAATPPNVDTPGAGRDRPGSSTAPPGNKAKKKKAGAARDPTHHQRGCHPARRSNPSAPRQGIKTASASRKIGRESSTLSADPHRSC